MHIHACILTLIHTYNPHTHTYTDAYILMYISTLLYPHSFTYIHVYKHIHSHTHAHKEIYIPS